MKKARNIIVLFAALLCVLAVTIIMWYLYQARGRIPAPAFGGTPLHIMLADNYAYQQRDMRWQGQHLGNNDKAGTLGKVGCTLSSIAVALSNLGIEVDPSTLNNELSQHNGFTERGWLIWSAVEKVTNGRAKAQAYSSPSRKQIDACLLENRYPIVKYLIGGVVQHWATVVGKQGGTYLIRDPLIAATKPEPLHHHTPVILSLRCIGLSNPEDMETAKKLENDNVDSSHEN